VRNRIAATFSALGATALLAIVLAASRAGSDGTPTAASGTAPSTPVSHSEVRRAGTPPSREASFDRTRHSTTDPASIWVVVNKKHGLPADFRPDLALVRGYQVATPAAGPLTRLLAAGDDAGLGLKIASAFRSYGYQVGVYGQHVAAGGRAEADTVSARPGHSEHQTGLAVDLVTPEDPGCDFDACFAATAAGRWLARDAWHYGFIVRYQPGNTAVTGYSPEPWHLRFVGRELAAELHREHVTSLETFFGISGGGYPGGYPGG
jgi:zinc D-Ala-D-Ala carboxypeptidase